MGIPDLIAEDTDEYVRLAIKLATEPAFYERMRSDIKAKQSTLFLRKATTSEWTDLLLEQGGRVEASTLLRSIRGGLSLVRERAVLQLFASLDVDKNGVLDAQDLTRLLADGAEQWHQWKHAPLRWRDGDFSTLAFACYARA